VDLLQPQHPAQPLTHHHRRRVRQILPSQALRHHQAHLIRLNQALRRPHQQPPAQHRHQDKPVQPPTAQHLLQVKPVLLHQLHNRLLQIHPSTPYLVHLPQSQLPLHQTLQKQVIMVIYVYKARQIKAAFIHTTARVSVVFQKNLPALIPQKKHL